MAGERLTVSFPFVASFGFGVQKSASRPL